MLTRQFGQDNDIYWQWKLSDDPQVKVAIRYLTNKNAYAELLQPRQSGVAGARK